MRSRSTGWATGISPGPADESGQAVTFVVDNDNPGLFTVQPAVAPDGTLTYKPKLIAVGTAKRDDSRGRQRRYGERWERLERGSNVRDHDHLTVTPNVVRKYAARCGS